MPNTKAISLVLSDNDIRTTAKRTLYIKAIFGNSKLARNWNYGCELYRIGPKVQYNQ